MKKLRKALQKDLYLAEMAVVPVKTKPQSFNARIRNEDHNPPHVHLFHENNELAGVFLITQNTPTKGSDILNYPGKKELDSKGKKIVCRFANKENDETKVNWNEFKVGWRQTHPNEEVKFV